MPDSNIMVNIFPMTFAQQKLRKRAVVHRLFLFQYWSDGTFWIKITTVSFGAY
jgi:hypothetical protein